MKLATVDPVVYSAQAIISGTLSDLDLLRDPKRYFWLTWTLVMLIRQGAYRSQPFEKPSGYQICPRFS